MRQTITIDVSMMRAMTRRITQLEKALTQIADISGVSIYYSSCGGALRTINELAGIRYQSHAPRKDTEAEAAVSDEFMQSASVSDAFMQSLSGAGSIVAECNCGRTYFVSNGDYDEGELNELRQKAAEAPDKYIEERSDDFIGFGMIDGRFFVHGCVCNGAARYETFIKNNQELIATYLAKTTGVELRQAIHSLQLAAVIEQAVRAPDIARRVAAVLSIEESTA